MMSFGSPRFLLLLLCVFAGHSVSASSSPDGGTFKLWRKSATTLNELRSHDRLRHGRHLDVASAQSFPLYSGFQRGLGLYYTELQIGTPATKYYVQVDTGSDLLWLNCGSCTGCPKGSNVLPVPLTLYHPEKSSSSSSIACGDDFCSQLVSKPCSPSGGQNSCTYGIGYGTGSSSGYIVQDVLQLPGSRGASAQISFGCATTPDDAVQSLDGILGLGPSPTSITSQLVNQKQSSAVFAHCLQGTNGKGGGSLVFGNVQATGLVYTPIVSSPTHYNVNLRSISVNGKTIPVDSSVSPTNEDTGTTIDSGTTLAYFSESVYQQLVAEILGSKGADECATYDGRVDDGFPDVTLNFEGSGAVMVIKPHDYMLASNEANVWCVGFDSATGLGLQETLLGDLVLSNKLVVYDLAQKRIGWVDSDCS